MQELTPANMTCTTEEKRVQEAEKTGRALYEGTRTPGLTAVLIQPLT
jgi:hypothetical protein